MAHRMSACADGPTPTMTAGEWALGVAAELGCDLRNVLALEARHGELAFARLAPAVAAGDGAGAIGRTAGDLVQPHLRLAGIGQADNHHALVQQGSVEGEDGALLAAMLGRGRGEHAA